jgi:hypothetical protein
VRVEIMGSQKCRIVGKSQSLLVMINPMIAPHTRIVFEYLFRVIYIMHSRPWRMLTGDGAEVRVAAAGGPLGRYTESAGLVFSRKFERLTVEIDCTNRRSNYTWA